MGSKHHSSVAYDHVTCISASRVLQSACLTARPKQLPRRLLANLLSRQGWLFVSSTSRPSYSWEPSSRDLSLGLGQYCEVKRFSLIATRHPLSCLQKMFVPKTAAASRNPRRRQRTSSDDSVKPPKAKRQRSVLRQSGDSQATSLNHDQREVAEPSIAIPPSDHDVVTTAIGPESHLPIRSAKQGEGPSSDTDGMVVLVRTLELPFSAILPLGKD